MRPERRSRAHLSFLQPAAARARARWGRHPCLPVRAASLPPVSMAEHPRRTGKTGQRCPAHWKAKMPAPPGWRGRQSACKKQSCAPTLRAHPDTAPGAPASDPAASDPRPASTMALRAGSEIGAPQGLLCRVETSVELRPDRSRGEIFSGHTRSRSHKHGHSSATPFAQHETAPQRPGLLPGGDKAPANSQLPWFNERALPHAGPPPLGTAESPPAPGGRWLA